MLPLMALSRQGDRDWTENVTPPQLVDPEARAVSSPLVLPTLSRFRTISRGHELYPKYSARVQRDL